MLTLPHVSSLREIRPLSPTWGCEFGAGKFQPSSVSLCPEYCDGKSSSSSDVSPLRSCRSPGQGARGKKKQRIRCGMSEQSVEPTCRSGTPPCVDHSSLPPVATCAGSSTEIPRVSAERGTLEHGQGCAPPSPMSIPRLPKSLGSILCARKFQSQQIFLM